MDPVPLDGLLGIAICLIFSAFFSGSETALTSISRARSQQLYELAGRPRTLRPLVEEPVEVLTTILIGNNLVNITASALATQVAEQLLGGAGGWPVNPVAVAVGVMTLLLLTFGEITPKSLARANAEQLAPIAMWVLTPMMKLLRPVVALFVVLSDRLARLTGNPLQEDGPFVREEDIEYLVELGHREGTLSAEREDLLRAVFDFTETTVREVMVPRTDVVFVPADISEDDLIDLILRCGHSRLPVYDRDTDDILGLFYAKDMLRRLREPSDDAPFDLRSYLREPAFVPRSKSISQLLREMQLSRIHMAVVVDEHGAVAGVVTLEDIIEEVLGDIRDEHDVESDLIRELAPGTWRIQAKIDLQTLGEELGLEDVVDDDCDTLGGYIAKVTGEVAPVGAEVEAWGMRFRVSKANARRVRSIDAVRVSPAAEPEA